MYPRGYNNDESDGPKSNSRSTGDDAESENRQKFGTRYLTDPKNVFQHNAWDNVLWDEDQEAVAKDIAKKHEQQMIPRDKRDEYEREAAAYWDKFYGIHSNHFFKDRHWLFTEFPELHIGNAQEEKRQASEPGVSTHCEVRANDIVEHKLAQCNAQSNTDSAQQCFHKMSIASAPELSQHENQLGCQEKEQDASYTLLEVGCGVGNTLFPVLKTNNNPNLMVFCCDFSSTAIDIVKAHPDYDQRRCHAFVHDITDENAQIPFPQGSLDMIIMIFVLSAICPLKMQAAVNRLSSYLKPGGMLLFRDYGRYDMAQLRFKEGRCLSENFYVRGDGTRVYFFTQDELRKMFGDAGLVEKENLIDRRLQVNRGRQLKMYRVWIQYELRKMFGDAGLVEKENLIDRRLQVNRGRQLKMYRVWIQCKYVKSND
ncbi:methyltransferase-like protein 2 [Plakobranchus ocellatus]|uniref:tRNA N(3)-methylcytidine methyltransferase n=1 Tax=Plakobranchus ocellatus TaxID=259542 RepID=A0AAV4DAE1_9GAST|nr:methyltransferase-like protein 2 [Plakobranchus ocellatus]